MSTIAEQEGFAILAALQGFDLPGFDAWLLTIKGTGAHAELIERRTLAWAALRVNDDDKALRHLEWMELRWRWIARADALAPMAALGAARSKQLAGFQLEGAKARTKYTDDDRAQWRQLYRDRYAHHTQRQAAALIVKALKLDTKATEAVRKALGKENG